MKKTIVDIKNINGRANYIRCCEKRRSDVRYEMEDWSFFNIIKQENIKHFIIRITKCLLKSEQHLWKFEVPSTFYSCHIHLWFQKFNPENVEWKSVPLMENLVVFEISKFDENKTIKSKVRRWELIIQKTHFQNPLQRSKIFSMFD